MSDEMRAQLRVRTHLALETRAKNSKSTGGKTFGFDGHGAIVNEEACIVHEVFDRFASGESMKGIVSDLNVRNIKSPGAGWVRTVRRTDGRWLVSGLRAILLNERYVGRTIWNRSTWIKDPDTGRRVRRERPESEWIVNEGPEVVSRDVWMRVQARLSERARSYEGGRGRHPRYLLSGILQCANCRGRMIIVGTKGSHYYCSTHHQGGSAACGMQLGVRRDLAEDLLLSPVRDQLLSPEAVTRVCGVIRDLHRQTTVSRLGADPADCVRLEAKIARYQGMIDADPECAGDLRVVIEKLRDDIVRLKRQKRRAASPMQQQAELPAEIAYRRQVNDMSGMLDWNQTTAARQVLKEILGDIPVRPSSSGRYLVAEVAINSTPLLRAAGVESDGSGGRI